MQTNFIILLSFLIFSLDLRAGPLKINDPDVIHQLFVDIEERPELQYNDWYVYQLKFRNGTERPLVFKRIELRSKDLGPTKDVLNDKTVQQYSHSQQSKKSLAKYPKLVGQVILAATFTAALLWAPFDIGIRALSARHEKKVSSINPYGIYDFNLQTPPDVQAIPITRMEYDSTQELKLAPKSTQLKWAIVQKPLVGVDDLLLHLEDDEGKIYDVALK